MMLSYIIYGFDDLLWNAICMKNLEQFVSVFLEVDENNEWPLSGVEVCSSLC